jgi:CheY-like chemotaxis protein
MAIVAVHLWHKILVRCLEGGHRLTVTTNPEIMIDTNMHILMADDDLDDVELFQHALTETHPDFELTTAKNGDELMSLLNELPVPDLIVMDINMPRKSGKECLAEIRSREQFDKVPVVIISDYKNPSGINYCLSHGANKYFEKPTTFLGIKELVKEICGVNLLTLTLIAAIAY